MSKRKPKPLILIDSPFRNTEDIFRLKPRKHSSIESDAWLADLKKDLERRGFSVSTVAGHDLAQADHLIFFDAVLSDPVFREFRRRRREIAARASLIVIDAAVINQYEHTDRALQLFDRVLTWDPNRIDKKKFFPYHLPERFYPRNPFRIPYRKKRFLCMINSYKHSIYPTELYSERKRAALFFEKTSEGIDVYGTGWDSRPALIPVLFHLAYRWKNVLHSIIRLDSQPHIKLFGYVFNRPRLKKQSIKGRFGGSSVAVYAKYRFAICFENARDIPGYATEKIFNCFNARCVPIYWGDAATLEDVPAGCYIDMRKFSTYDQLYAFLHTIDEKKYRRYLDRIETYLKTAKKGKYGIPAFTKAVYDGLIRS